MQIVLNGQPAERASVVRGLEAFCHQRQIPKQVMNAADVALGYAGTVDRWGTIQGDAVVVDVKTGAVPSWAPLQLVAYARLPLGGPSARRRRIVLQLRPTGQYRIHEYPIVNFGRDERIFLSALAIAHWKRAA